MTAPLQATTRFAPILPPATIRLADHYWKIGKDDAHVYSSGRNIMVPLDDKSYVDWSAFRMVTPIGTEAELAEVLKDALPEWLLSAPSFIQPKAGAYSKEQLIAYAKSVRGQKIAEKADVEARLHALELQAVGDKSATNELFDLVNGIYGKFADVVKKINGGSIAKLEQVNAAFG